MEPYEIAQIIHKITRPCDNPDCVPCRGTETIIKEPKAEINTVNPRGKYPLCMPIVGDLSSTCARCGDYAGYDRPCPAVPPERRWGPDYVPPRDAP